jgi:hypothetical protein
VRSCLIRCPRPRNCWSTFPSVREWLPLGLQ